MAAKSGPFVADGYVKANNTTAEFQLWDTTGALYTGGLKVTPPSTLAWTAVGTTAVQELTNKTINNITITDPTSDAAGTLTIAGSLVTAGAYQHKFTAGANSAVTMPSATDAILMWTTETSAKITAKTSQINVLSAVTWPSTAAQTLVNTTGVQTLNYKTLGAGVADSIETATSDSTLTNYGVSVVNSIAAGGAFTVGIAAPSSGIFKTIVVPFANSSDTVVISNASTAVQFAVRSTDTFNIITFSAPGSAQLVGISTAVYQVLSLGSTALAATTSLPVLSS